MKYWSTQELLNSGRLWRRHRREIARLLDKGTPLTFATLAELHQISAAVPACTSLALIHSEGCPFRRVYLKHPTQENWLAVERGGFVATEETFGFVMDALH